MNKDKLLQEMNTISAELINEFQPKTYRECVWTDCRNKPIKFMHVFNDKSLPKKWYCKKHLEE